MNNSNKTAGLYVHIPFCGSKCHYCDFNSSVQNEDVQSAYIEKLLKEIDYMSLIYSNADLEYDTIFIGGGTPSVIDPAFIERILDKLSKSFQLSKQMEITIECNPNSISKDKLLAYKKAGVNRISLGVQSTNDGILKAIGRTHTQKDVFFALQSIRDAGILNYNVDIMLGLPNQTIADVENTINDVLKFEPTHISAYTLMLEKGTPLYKMVSQGVHILPKDDDVVDQYNKTLSLLEQNGLYRYEISNFAKRGCECKHNIHYWDCDQYLGFGVSAHSYMDGARFANPEDLKEYLDVQEFRDYELALYERLNETEQKTEYIMLHLRQTKGIDFAEYHKIFDEDLRKVKRDILKSLSDRGLIQMDAQKICIAPKHFSISNAIIEELI